MKARVKATGHIVDVELSHYVGDVAWYITKCHASYSENELEFIDAPEDYWTRLEHQYAGMAMQGLISNEAMLVAIGQRKDNTVDASIAKMSFEFATALVKQLKEEERK